MDFNELGKRDGPYRLSGDELECCYCQRTVDRSMAQLTCLECRKALVKEYGPDWHQADWHQEMLELHRQAFARAPRGTISLADRADIICQPIEPLPADWAGKRRHYQAYVVIKDVCARE